MKHEVAKEVPLQYRSTQRDYTRIVAYATRHRINISEAIRRLVAAGLSTEQEKGEIH